MGTEAEHVERAGGYTRVGKEAKDVSLVHILQCRGSGMLHGEGVQGGGSQVGLFITISFATGAKAESTPPWLNRAKGAD